MQKVAALFLVFLLNAPAWTCVDTNPVQHSVKITNDIEVPISVYGASRHHLILWLPSEHGVLAAEHEIARQLAQTAKPGYEVWIADLFAAHFLPNAPSSLTQIPASDVTQIIAAAARRHTHIYLLTSGLGAGRALEGARLWLRRNPQRPLAGAVLLFPNLYAASPEAGKTPPYLPVVSQTRLPIAVLQGNLSPWYWQLEELQTQLKRGGSRVKIQTLTGMRDRFYFREDALPREREAGQRLATEISDSIRNLPSIKRGKTP